MDVCGPCAYPNPSRLATHSDREDFLTKMIEARKEVAISDAQIAAHSSDFVYVVQNPARGTWQKTPQI